MCEVSSPLLSVPSDKCEIHVCVRPEYAGPGQQVPHAHTCERMHAPMHVCTVGRRDSQASDGVQFRVARQTDVNSYAGGRLVSVRSTVPACIPTGRLHRPYRHAILSRIISHFNYFLNHILKRMYLF